MDPEEQDILDEFLGHGRAVRAERERAAAAGEKPDFIALVRSWGGVTLAYRKRMQDSPAYRLNHEEVDQGARRRHLVRREPQPGRSRARRVRARQGHDLHARRRHRTIELPARTVLVAAGTVPNITYEKEHPGTFSLDGKQKFFQGFRAVKRRDGRFALEPDANGFFTSYNTGGKFVTYYGDNHPRYNGNVVKAMASAKHGYPRVVELFADEIAALDPALQPARERAWQDDGAATSTINCSRASSGSSG